MLYLVDGYNVTRRDPATCDLSLAEQRDALVARLRVRGRDLLGRGRIVVVFDGEGGPGLSTGGEVPVEIVYAHARSADDEIVRIAAGAGQPVTIVSSDREVGGRATQRSAAKVTVREASTCFEAARGARRKRARGTISRDAGLPRGAAAITRELKDLWLSNDKSDEQGSR
jgi:predicted RNA-binding protein with PIN domain